MCQTVLKILPSHLSVTFKDPGYLTLSTAAAISQVGEQPAGHFRDLFLPNGQALSAGSYLSMPGVADIMQAGFFSFYHGNVSQELEDEVVHRLLGLMSPQDVMFFPRKGASKWRHPEQRGPP